jgi:pSer/pThr/pTyr-binding forkhead associated (FHA) protein/tetratricopeptide (TPR) repeat protein
LPATEGDRKADGIVPRLVVFHGNRPEQYVELTDRDLRIGRVAENDLVLSDPDKTVSRFHAELRFEGGRYVLIDLNSQNGIWQDGRRVQKAVLEPGRPVSLGSFRLVLEEEMAAPGAALADTGVGLAASQQQTRIAEAMPVPPPSVPPPMPPPTPAAPPPAAAAPAAVEKRKGRKPLAAAPQGPPPSLISRIAQPKVFFSVLGLLVLVIIGRIMLAPGEEPAAPETAGAGEATTPVETNEQIIARHLAEGRSRMEQGDLDGAVAAFEKALIINADHPEALELKIKAEELRRERAATQVEPATAAEAPAAPAQPQVPSPPPSEPPAATSPATGGAGATVAPPSRPATPRRPPRAVPDEKSAAATALAQQYEQARGLLAKGQFSEAIAALEAIQAKSPGYGESEKLLAEARAGIRQQAQAAMDQGTKLMKEGDLLGARRQFERAQALDRGVPGLADAQARLRAEMTVAGEQAYRRARQYDAMGRGADALPLYEQALQLLPEGHASRQTAQERVAALRATIR